MWYAIMATDVSASSAIRAARRTSHLEYVRNLQDQGRLLIAGPHPLVDSPSPGPAGVSGSLIVADFASLEAARNWADRDPYAVAGVFASIEIKPFVRVLP